MPLIIPAGYVQAVYELLCAGDSETMVITCGHRFSDLSDPVVTANFLHTQFAEDIVPTMMNSYTFTGVTIYIGDDPNPPAVEVSSLANVVGGVASDPEPPNTAAIIRKRTDLAGRRGRGRMYVPGWVNATATTANGLTTAGELTRLQNAANAWYADLIAAGSGGESSGFPYVLHRSEGEGPEPAPTPITSFQVDQRQATQRRRLRP
jgi:hypothetical protein